MNGFQVSSCVGGGGVAAAANIRKNTWLKGIVSQKLQVWKRLE